MGRKRKNVEPVAEELPESPPPVKKSAAQASSPAKKKKSKRISAAAAAAAQPPPPKIENHSDDEMLNNSNEVKKESDFDTSDLPTSDVLSKLLDRIESALPRDDQVKFDSRAKKLDWEKIAFDNLSSTECQRIWGHIQERIRRFRIMSEMIPDAREWINHPWTNFYKSKDHNRHPDMPKKPLSMYMLFYSQRREQILKENPKLNMPDVAKICSEQYQKLPEKKKNKYKVKCDAMRKEYEEKLQVFYQDHPELKPVTKKEQEKNKKAAAAAAAASIAAANNATPQPLPPAPPQPQPPQSQPPQINLPMAPPANLQPPANIIPVTLSLPINLPTVPIQPDNKPIISAPNPPIQFNNIVYDPKFLPRQPEPPGPPGPPANSLPVPSSSGVNAPGSYPGAPERPAKPFDLFFKTQMENHANDPNFDRQAFAEKYRKEWKEMKVKKKAKWIKAASDNYRQYEEKVANYIKLYPGYTRPPQQKNFLTQEDQKILDKFMGRPEKPPSSAYSLFSKEMLNNEEIKKFPSKERMAQISEKWKVLGAEQKDKYQREVSQTMGVYRQEYEEWFSNLSEEERKAETNRNSLKKNTRNPPTAKVVPPASVGVSSPPVLVQQGSVTSKNIETLKSNILKREPVEPARSPKQLFINEWLLKHKKKKAGDAKEVWKRMEKKAKKIWQEKLEPQRQKYIEAYTVFVRGLDKEELELYTDLKQKRDDEEEAKRQNESSDSDEDSDSSDSSDSDEDSDSESD